MHRLTSLSSSAWFALTTTALLALSTATGCGGGGKPAEGPTEAADSGAESTGGETGETTSSEGDAGAPVEKKDECVGFDIGNIEDVLTKSACEEPSAKPDSLPTVDMKGKLEVTVAASPTKVAPGGKSDLVVTFANKTKAPLTLHFRIDPVPRFDTETFDAKNKRVDMPAGNPPPPPKGQSAPPPSEVKAAKVTIAANGFARARVPWEAVKMKWAPEKVRGTSPEKGYPRSPAGPLPKGKYTVKVKTPLVGVSEGIDHEVSAPKVELEIGG